MKNVQNQGSEVARLLQQIQAEFEAAQSGIKGLAYGTAQHQVITQKMERMCQLQEDLGVLVGDDAMIVLVARQLDACSDSIPPA